MYRSRYLMQGVTEVTQHLREVIVWFEASRTKEQLLALSLADL